MTEPTLLYTAGRQVWKVRALMWLLLAAGLGCLWWGLDLAQTYGLNPGDGGVLRPPAERLAWGLGVGLLGLLPTLGMDLYGRLYVARIDLAAGDECLAVTTLRYWGSAVRRVAVARVLGSKYEQGRFQGRQTVEAPWYFVSIQGARLPLILDAQGQFSDFARAARLLRLTRVP